MQQTTQKEQKISILETSEVAGSVRDDNNKSIAYDRKRALDNISEYDEA